MSWLGLLRRQATHPVGAPEKSATGRCGTDPCATMNSVMESVVGSACIEIARAVRQGRPRPVGPSSNNRSDNVALSVNLSYTGCCAIVGVA